MVRVGTVHTCCYISLKRFERQAYLSTPSSSFHKSLFTDIPFIRRCQMVWEIYFMILIYCLCVVRGVGVAKIYNHISHGDKEFSFFSFVISPYIFFFLIFFVGSFLQSLFGVYEGFLRYKQKLCSMTRYELNGIGGIRN